MTTKPKRITKREAKAEIKKLEAQLAVLEKRLLVVWGIANATNERGNLEEAIKFSNKAETLEGEAAQLRELIAALGQV